MARPPLYLLVGPEELLLRRAAERILDELRVGGELDLDDLRAAELSREALPDLRTGSLFGAPRALLIRDAHELPAAVAAELAAQLQPTPPEATVVLLARGTQRIRRLAALAAEFGGRVDVAPPRDWEEAKWAALVGDELRRHGRSAERAAVEAVLDHAGLDVGRIAGKVAQLAVSAPAGRITREQVDALLVGHGSRGSFAVADAMCDRRPAEALRLLRGALEAGADPVMVLGALVYRLRSIVAVAGGLEPRTLGLNVSRGQARRLQALRRNFGPGELTRAYRTLAEADADIKGGELPPVLVLERAVTAVAGGRDGRSRTG